MLQGAIYYQDLSLKQFSPISRAQQIHTSSMPKYIPNIAKLINLHPFFCTQYIL